MKNIERYHAQNNPRNKRFIEAWNHRPRVRYKMRNNKKSNFTFEAECKIASKTSKERKEERNQIGERGYSWILDTPTIVQWEERGSFVFESGIPLVAKKPSEERTRFWIGSRNRYLTASNFFSSSFPETTSEEDGFHARAANAAREA